MLVGVDGNSLPVCPRRRCALRPVRVCCTRISRLDGFLSIALIVVCEVQSGVLELQVSNLCYPVVLLGDSLVMSQR